MTTKMTVTRYDVSFDGTVWMEGVGRSVVARCLRSSRSELSSVNVTWTRRTRTVTIPDESLCYGCKARPALWENDCDGPYMTATCGSPQCQWWEAVEARDVARKAGCAGSNPKHALYANHNC